MNVYHQPVPGMTWGEGRTRKRESKRGTLRQKKGLKKKGSSSWGGGRIRLDQKFEEQEARGCQKRLSWKGPSGNKVLTLPEKSWKVTRRGGLL